MRIVAGKFARRVLAAPEGLATRPTADRTREALFNILQHQDWGRDVITGAKVLDACCGTGALALEALSRGAAKAWLMEQDAAAYRVAQENIATLKLQAECQLLRADASKPPRAMEACDLVFLDPPYHKNLPAQILPALQAASWIAPDALLVLETARDEPALPPPQWQMKLARVYGAAMLRFYRFATA